MLQRQNKKLNDKMKANFKETVTTQWEELWIKSAIVEPH